MNSSKICGYDKGGTIGKGSYGVVIKVTEDDEEYAFKLAAGEYNYGIPSILEIDIMSRLSHPNLMNAFDIYTSYNCVDLKGSDVGILMPLARSDLGIIFKPELIPEKLVNPDGNSHQNLTFDIRLELVNQILRGVQFLHQMDIYHLDLKPENILLFGSINDPEDPLTAKISDFGIAYYCPFPTKGCPDYSLRISNLYRPPESFEQIKYPYRESLELLPKYLSRYLYQEKSDIWSLGIIIGEIFTGKRMIDVSNTNGLDQFIKVIFSNETVDQFLNDYFSVSNVEPSFKREIISILKKLLSLDLKNRPTILEILGYPLFQNFNQDIIATIYTPNIGDNILIDFPKTRGGLTIIENLFRLRSLEPVGSFFLAVDLYYRGLTFPQNNNSHTMSDTIRDSDTIRNSDTIRDSDILLIGIASIHMALNFYDILIPGSVLLNFANLDRTFTPNDLHTREVTLLDLFGNIIYRTYIYEKAPNLEALLSSYSLLFKSNYLTLDLDSFYKKYQHNQPSKSVSVGEYFSML